MNTTRLVPRNKYVSFALLSAQRALTYRRSTVFDIAGGVVWVVILINLWSAVYSSRSAVGGFGWEAMKSYVILTYMLNSLISGSTEWRISEPIRKGNIAFELTRPSSFFLTQLAQTLGATAVQGVPVVAVGLVAALTLGGIRAPTSWVAGSLFVCSSVLGLLVKFLISYIVGLLCFWTTQANGLIWARNAISNLLSGAIVPLQLLPREAALLGRVTPFKATVFTPVSIYLGRIREGDVLGALGVQLLWIALLTGVAAALWRPSTRAVTIFGG